MVSKIASKKKNINLEKDLRINNFFPENKSCKPRPISPYLFVLGLILLSVMALGFGVVTMMAAK